MSTGNFDIIQVDDHRFIKAWKRGVQFEEKAVEQAKNTARLPFVHPYLALMADCHWGMGATIGSVLPTKGAVVPAAVGVDIGCGMMAVRLNLLREAFVDLPAIRAAIEKVVPAGRTENGGPGDRGAWHNVPIEQQAVWDGIFSEQYEELCSRYPGMRAKNTARHLGTLGTGNHFLELVTDEEGRVWVVLHSGSRGMGNKIGTYFTQLAQELCQQWYIQLPERDLAYLPKDTAAYDAYLQALELAQRFAWTNRELMMDAAIKAIVIATSQPTAVIETVHCHHNYAAWEHHFGENVLVTRKGAVRARTGDLGIIPGSMGTRSYIVRGLGSPHSFCSCSHGAGRAMGRQEAKRRFTVDDHTAATAGIECDKSAGTLDETPAAYKPIEAVIAAQSDLIEVVHELRQFICVKGVEDAKRRR